MTKLIRKYQKWALAFFGVLLMLTFLGNRGNGGGADTSEHVLGHLDGKAITRADVEEARAELSALDHYLILTDPTTYRQMSLLVRIFGPQKANELIEKPTLFFLLREEARRSGATVNPTELDQLMTQFYQGPAAESDEYSATRAALGDVLLVSERFQQLESDVKLSQPALNHVLASQRETIGINFVQLQASDYASKVPPPTTQQVREQFEKFANTLPGNESIELGTNPFGFGYKLPVRAQLQYLSILPRSIDDAVVAAGPADVARPTGWSMELWWDLAGKKYYRNHLSDFAPASDDSTTKPAGPQPIPSYEKVRDQVLATIRKPATEKLLEDIRSYVNTNLNTGWQTYRQFAGATPPPATEPVAGLGEKYSSFQYLTRLADEVHSRFHVIATADDTQRPVALPLSKTLAVPALGDAQISDFVSAQVNAFLATGEHPSPAAVGQLMRPSPPMQSQSSAPVVFVRVVSALPAAPPSDVSVVQAAVEQDLRTAASYALAKADADALLSAANGGTLPAAALKLGHAVLSTLPNSPLSLNPDSEQSTSPTSVVYPPLGDFDGRFKNQAFALLGTYNPKTNPTPAKLIELQPQGRLFVVQLKNVNADWSSQDYYKMVLQTRRSLTRDLLPRLSEKWFDYDAVIQRTGYQPAKTASG